MRKSMLVFLTISLLCLLFGCSTEEPNDTISTLMHEPEPVTISIFSCSSNPDENGYYQCQYNGIDRKFMLHIPEDVKDNFPLVFMLHGYSSSAKGFMYSTGMNKAADKYGYAVVYPQGIKDPANTTGGACWNSGLTNSVNDDAGFLAALAKYLQKTYGFSSSATFAAGFSNGAFMMYKLAVEAPDTFRAVASVSGMMSGGAWDERPDSASVGILQINGTNDSVVPIDKNGVYGDAPAIGGVIDYWKNADGLEKYSNKEISDKATANCYSSKINDNLVWYIEIEGGGHSWPTAQSAGFDANELILNFFSHYVK